MRKQPGKASCSPISSPCLYYSIPLLGLLEGLASLTALPLGSACFCSRPVDLLHLGLHLACTWSLLKLSDSRLTGLVRRARIAEHRKARPLC